MSFQSAPVIESSLNPVNSKPRTTLADQGAPADT